MTDKSGMHFYDPAQGHGLPHDPFKAIIAPRPIGWISTLSPDGVANLAPYSFFAPICDRPPMLMFVSEAWKDTVANAEATGDFVWNMASRDLAQAMNVSAALVGAGVDEFELAGLEKAPGRVVRCPRVAASPVSIECRVVEIRRVTTMDGDKLERRAVTGQAVGVHICRKALRDGIFDTSSARPIGRGGYRDEYFEANSEAMFRMLRPDG